MSDKRTDALEEIMRRTTHLHEGINTPLSRARDAFRLIEGATESGQLDLADLCVAISNTASRAQDDLAALDRELSEIWSLARNAADSFKKIDAMAALPGPKHSPQLPGRVGTVDRR